MASNGPKLQTLHEEEEEEENGLFQPMSPSSQCIHTPILSICIIAITGSEIPIDVSKVKESIQRDLLNINSRFSSIVIHDKHGNQWWKRVDVQVENHIVVPTYPIGSSQEAYTKHFKDYLEKIHLIELPETQPLWEVHIFNYPTIDAVGTIALKMHHALGDGFSLMGALFSCLKRADDPSLPLTFPSSCPSNSSLTNKGVGFGKRVFGFVSGCWYTISDFAWSVLKSTVVEDDRTVIRSSNPALSYTPKEITSVVFSLDDLRMVKSKIKGSINDVVVGIIFHGIHLYTEAMNCDATHLRRTALVLLNTRMVNGYRNIDDMLEKKLWGNHFSFISLSIPSYSDEPNVDPLKFIFKAKDVIKRNRNSMGVYLNSSVLRLVGCVKGSEGISQYLNSTLMNTSVTITNMVGPVEKMGIAGHPINYIYFTLTGTPQSLVFTVMSYMGKLRIVATTEKDFIDSQLLVSCMKEGFEKMFKAANNI